MSNIRQDYTQGNEADDDDDASDDENTGVDDNQVEANNMKKKMKEFRK